MKLHWVVIFEKVVMPLINLVLTARTKKQTPVAEPVVVDQPVTVETAQDRGEKNLRAFLDVIAFSEGTDNGKQTTKDRGYDVLVGGKNFESYKDHPRVVVPLPKLGINSSAAGRYQILGWVFDHYKVQLKLPDFSPDSQDKIAIQLIRECKALDDVKKGGVETAITKCRSRWASFPGAGYGQHEQKMSTLISVFHRSGGVSTL